MMTTMPLRVPRARLARALPLLLLPAALAGLATSGCAPGGDAETPEAPPRNVRVLTLAPATLNEYLELSGPVMPVRGTDVGAEESGTVWAVPHDKGERVSAGDVLVELDRRLLAAEAASALANLEFQAYSVDKVRRLHEAGKISRQELLSAEALHEQAVAASRIADLRHERAAVKAPFAGLVTDRYVEPGQLVPAGTPVARVIDPYTLELRGSLTEDEVRWVSEDAPATVLLDGHDAPVQGTVQWVGFEADPRNGKFQVEIHVPNPDLALRSGVVGRARVLKLVHEDVLAIPRDAVVNTREGTSVYLVQGDTAAVRPVRLGPDQGLMVVVESGLHAGERLVVRGQRDLLPGARVLVTEEALAGDGTGGGDPQVVRAAAAASRAARGREDAE